MFTILEKLIVDILRVNIYIYVIIYISLLFFQLHIKLNGYILNHQVVVFSHRRVWPNERDKFSKTRQLDSYITTYILLRHYVIHLKYILYIYNKEKKRQ